MKDVNVMDASKLQKVEIGMENPIINYGNKNREWKRRKGVRRDANNGEEVSTSAKFLFLFLYVSELVATSQKM